MDCPNSERDPIEELAEEFLERYRGGERRSVDDYAVRYPELAERIRKLFPTLLMMERARPSPLERVPRSEGTRAERRIEHLGDYRILRELGRGGMGIVYEAEQESLGRHVALKVLPGHSVLDARHLERFRREAKTAARLHHTNIVPVHGIGEQDGLHYIVMQFIQGLGLDEVLAELIRLRQRKPDAPGPGGARPARPAPGSAADVAQALLSGEFAASRIHDESPPPADQRAPESGHRSSIRLPGHAHNSTLSESGWPYWRSIARVGLQVADALAHAHAQGILHRDIKPSNLLLDAHGVVWITDFGLAKTIDDAENLTHTGDIVGTMRYMAPERFQGKADVRSDVYALGLTLYELLTLRPAFGASERDQLMAQVLRDEPPRPRKLDPRVPRDLETIVLKAAARDPALRYQTPAELAEDLQRFLDDRPIRARRLSPVLRGWRWCRRNPGMALLVGAVAVLLLAVTAGSWIALWRLQYEQDQTVEQLRRAEKAEEDSKDRLWESCLAQAQARRWKGMPGRHFNSLESLQNAAAIRATLVLRNEAAACIPLVDLQPHARWDWPDGLPRHFAPTLEHYVRVDRGALTVYRAADDREVMCLANGNFGGAVGFSPDGRFLLAQVGNTRLHEIWEIETQRKIMQVELPEAIRAIPECWAFRPDGRQLAVSTDRGVIRLYDLSSQAVRELVLGSGKLGVIYDPEGQRLAVHNWDKDQTLRVVEINTGRVVQRLAHPSDIFRAAWSPDGTMLAVPCEDGRIYLWDARTGKRRALLEKHEHAAIRCAFNHHGDLLASYGYDGAVRLWNPCTGAPLLAVTGTQSFAFSADDRHLALRTMVDASLWEVARGLACRTICTATPANWTSPAISPCGRWLALTDPSGTHLFDLASHPDREIALVPTGPGVVVRFDADGSLVVAGAAGVRRWPLGIDARAGVLNIGPPQTVCKPTGDFEDCSRDGRWLYTVMGPAEHLVRDLQQPDRSVRLRGHHGSHSCTVSPDGQWMATGTRHGSGIKVWDVARGEAVHEIAAGHWAAPEFSPDGKWLATAWEEGKTQLWEVGTWQLRREWLYPLHPPGHLFSGDSKMLAIRHTRNTLITLVDVVSGAELVTLTPPQALLLGDLCFSHDSTKLAVSIGAAVHLWDLAAIRNRLRAMHLDWDPPLAPASTPADARPLRVEVVTGSARPSVPNGLRQALDKLRSIID
jgi:serine/threonine protein kinase/WD40 repeat protein